MAQASLREQRPRGSRRGLVLDRALEVASHEGLDGLSIGRLADDLGLSKSGLFGHFGSKERLQIETLMHASTLVRRHVIAPALAERRGEPRLRALVDRYLSFLETQAPPGGCLLAAVAPEWDSREGAVADAVREVIRQWLCQLKDQARIAGVPEPDTLALTLVGITFAANTALQISRNPVVFDQARSAVEHAYRAHGLDDDREV